jgi:uncharacterized membrane protein YphA (DoxX/SURF4 family)
MRCRDHIALTLPTFLLRLALAIIFLWAGIGKIVGTTTTQGDNAARLANLGVTFLADTPPETPSDSEPESDLPAEPVNPLPDSESLENEADPADSLPATDDRMPPATPETQEDEGTDSESHVLQTPNYTFTHVVQSTAPAVGSDYPDPVRIKNLYKITLLLDNATSPGLTEDSQPITPTMPSWMGSGKMPVYAAWATAITEIAAGLFLLIGLLTRLSALSLTIVMLVAIWTTNIGPAALQSSDAILGFIPHAADPWNPAAYSTLLWQFSIIIMSLSVFLLGAGPLSMDRLLFRPGRRDPYVSGTPERQQPKIKQDAPAPESDRTSFDRTPPPPSNPTP